MKYCIFFLFTLISVKALHRQDVSPEDVEISMTEVVEKSEKPLLTKETYTALKLLREKERQRARDRKRRKCEEGSDEWEKAILRPSQDRSSLEHERKHQSKLERQHSKKERRKLHKQERRRKKEELARLYSSKKPVSEITESR